MRCSDTLHIQSGLPSCVHVSEDFHELVALPESIWCKQQYVTVKNMGDVKTWLLDPLREWSAHTATHIATHTATQSWSRVSRAAGWHAGGARDAHICCNTCAHLLQHMRTFFATHAHICCNTCAHLLQHMRTFVATHAHICCNTCTHLLQHMHSFVAVSCSLLHTHRLDGGVQRFLHGKIVPTIRSPWLPRNVAPVAIVPPTRVGKVPLHQCSPNRARSGCEARCSSGNGVLGEYHFNRLKQPGRSQTKTPAKR